MTLILNVGATYMYLGRCMYNKHLKSNIKFDVILENPAYGEANSVFLDQPFPYYVFIDCFEIVSKVSKVSKVRKTFCAHAHM